MKKRERVLAIITAVIVGGALAYNFLLGDVFEGSGGSGGSGLASTSLAVERRRFERYADTLRDGPRIRQQYQAIASLESLEGTGRTPEDTFSNELYNLLTRRLGVESPRIEPPDLAPVEDVDDYYFVEINVGVDGRYNELVRLLQDMEQLGLLIKSFDLSMSGRGRGDRLLLNVTVARLVKHDDRSRRLMRRFLR